jgi:hypothetical protein
VLTAEAVCAVLGGQPAESLDGLGCPLLCVGPDVGAAPGHGEDQALAAEDIDGPEHSVATHVVRLLELLYGRQRTVAPLALGDPRPEDGGQLLVGRFRCPVINGHMIKLDHCRSDLIT